MEMLFYMILILLSDVALSAETPTPGPPPGSASGGPITCGETIDGIINKQGESVTYEFTQEYRSTPTTFFSFSTCDTSTTSSINTGLRVDANDGTQLGWFNPVPPGYCDEPGSSSQYCTPCKISNNGEIMAADMTKPNSGHTRWITVIAAIGSGTFKISLDCPTNAPTMTPTSGTSTPTTSNPTTDNPTTYTPTTTAPTTSNPTTYTPTTTAPTTDNPTTYIPTTSQPSTYVPTTNMPTTDVPTTNNPTTIQPSTDIPTTSLPTTNGPTITLPIPDAPTQFPTWTPIEQSTEATENGNGGAKNSSANSGLTGDSLLLGSIIGGCVVSFCLGILITLFCVKRRNKQKDMDALDKEIKITVTSNGVTENGNTSNGTTTETEMVSKKSIDLSEENDDNELDEMYVPRSMNVTDPGEMKNNGKELVRLKSNESVEGNNNAIQMTIGNEDSDDEMYKTELNHQTVGQ